MRSQSSQCISSALTTATAAATSSRFWDILDLLAYAFANIPIFRAAWDVCNVCHLHNFFSLHRCRHFLHSILKVQSGVLRFASFPFLYFYLQFQRLPFFAFARRSTFEFLSLISVYAYISVLRTKAHIGSKSTITPTSTSTAKKIKKKERCKFEKIHSLNKQS